MAQPAIDKILGTLNSAIICLDANQTISYVNSTAEMLFDSSAESLRGKSFGQLLRQAETSTIVRTLREFQTAPQLVTAYEASIVLAKGRRVTVDCTVYPLEDAVGCHQILIEIRPIDRHKKILREELSHLHQLANRQLARGIAHELKNPLGGIRGAAQLLGREIDEPLKEYTDVITSEVDRLQALIDNMLGPNRKAAKKFVNILEILEHVRSLLLAAESGRFEIYRDYDPSIPELWADKDQLIQALLNIGQNAVQALDHRGEIRFITRIERQYTIGQILHPLVMQIDIIDNGHGIAAHLNDTIFLPMVTDKPMGSGIGLPIAQDIVSRHGGVIRHESDASGTKFSIILPLEAR